MMAAAQPFLSGAISKTVNMPRDTTTEDIAKAYFDGWKLGLKALAIYRDGSKESQPLATSTEGQRAAAAAAAVAKPRRERLPDTRQSITHKFSVAGHEGYITVGLFPDGRPGELFITMAKEGSTIGGLMDAFGTAVSMSLQYGVPLEDYVRKFCTCGSSRRVTRRTRTSASPRASSTTSSAGSASRSCPATRKPAWACCRRRKRARSRQPPAPPVVRRMQRRRGFRVQGRRSETRHQAATAGRGKARPESRKAEGGRRTAAQPQP